jgi:hypothetical protein
LTRADLAVVVRPYTICARRPWRTTGKWVQPIFDCFVFVAFAVCDAYLRKTFFLQANVDIFQSNTVFTLREVLKEQAARVGILLIVGVHPLKEPGYYKAQKYSFDH